MALPSLDPSPRQAHRHFHSLCLHRRCRHRRINRPGDGATAPAAATAVPDCSIPDCDGLTGAADSTSTTGAVDDGPTATNSAAVAGLPATAATVGYPATVVAEAVSITRTTAARVAGALLAITGAVLVIAVLSPVAGLHADAKAAACHCGCWISLLLPFGLGIRMCLVIIF